LVALHWLNPDFYPVQKKGGNKQKRDSFDVTSAQVRNIRLSSVASSLSSKACYVKDETLAEAL